MNNRKLSGEESCLNCHNLAFATLILLDTSEIAFNVPICTSLTLQRRLLREDRQFRQEIGPMLEKCIPGPVQVDEISFLCKYEFWTPKSQSGDFPRVMYTRGMSQEKRSFYRQHLPDDDSEDLWQAYILPENLEEFS